MLTRSAIRRLFFPCRPSAIVRRIRTVVVYAVNRMAHRRSLAHVLSERLKIQPLLANTDASSAVAWKHSRVRIKASTFHCSPHVIHGGLRTAVSAPSRGRDFFSEAPATVAFSASQLRSRNMSNLAAFASANPCRLIVDLEICSANNDESSEPIPSVFNDMHTLCILSRFGNK